VVHAQGMDVLSEPMFEQSVGVGIIDRLRPVQGRGRRAVNMRCDSGD